MKVIDTQTNHTLELRKDGNFVTVFDLNACTSGVELIRWVDEKLFSGRYRQV